MSWYDERNTTDDSLERFGRESFDNGASWEPDGSLSDVVFPKPLQGSSLFRSTSVGTFNYAAFSDDGFGPIAYHTWTDGRVNTQQDVFFDKVNVVPNAPLVVTTIADHFDGSCDAADWYFARSD